MECLGFTYFITDDPTDGNISPTTKIDTLSGAALAEAFGKSGKNGGGAFGGGAFGSDVKPSLSTLHPKKRYVERRNWLHPIWSFWRVHSFLLLTLHVLFVFAFLKTRTGVIFDGALLEALCGIVVTHVTLSLLREFMTIFCMFGMLTDNPLFSVSIILRLILKLSFAAIIGHTYLAMLARFPLAMQRRVPAGACLTIL